ncbi:MAG: hypothetical protein CMK09_16245 [Ponticaulis sp.]|nr:hypothetical protein [Ponticaulis sp.]
MLKDAGNSAGDTPDSIGESVEPDSPESQRALRITSRRDDHYFSETAPPIARTLTVLCCVQAVMGTIALLLDIFGDRFYPLLHAICLFAILVISAIPVLIARTGKIELSAWCFNLTISISVFVLCLFTAGIASASTPILILPIVWSWLTLSRPGALIICALSLIEVLILAWWTAAGYAPQEATHLAGLSPPLGLALIFTMVGVSATISGYVAFRNNARDRDRLIRARDAAKKADRAKSEFIASIAHEVRTPLTGLMGMLQLLEKEKLDGAQADMAATANSSARNLHNLINDLLDLSKIEIGELRLLPEPTDVMALFDETVKEFRQAADMKGINLKVEQSDASLWLLVDPTRFRQVISNYLSNAVKFTETGEITAQLNALDEEQSKVRLRLTIQDTGPGIPTSQIRKIFGRFTQVDGTQRSEHHGTGLGLAIVADLARLQGGEAWADSQEGVGSAFHFECVFKRTSAMDLPKIRNVVEDSSSATILIADDSLGNQRVLTRVLQGLGFSTISVSNGSDAIVSIARQNIDLVLMDFNMPVKDGPTALKDIRSLPDPAKSEIPVIGLSADASQAHMDRWKDAGVDGFVHKPVDFAALDLTIRRVLGQNRNSEHENSARSAS